MSAPQRERERLAALDRVREVLDREPVEAGLGQLVIDIPAPRAEQLDLFGMGD